MKIGIIGAGRVGQACTMAVLLRDVFQEIVLVNRTREKADGVITDMQYGAPIASAAKLRAGDYDDLSDSNVVMIAAGINEKSGGATDKNDPQGRLKLLDKNVEAYREIVPHIAGAAPAALLLVVTDPPDPLADLTRRLARHDRVLSTGTYLDSLRFRVHIGRRLGIGANSVDAMVVGEHGKSEVFVWSSVRVCGIPLEEVLEARRIEKRNFQENIEREVRDANITIIEGNDASQYGIGIVSARIAEIVARDEREVIPVGSYIERYGVTLSVPTLLGREGVIQRFEPHLSDDEHRGFERSAEVLKQAVERAGVA